MRDSNGSVVRAIRGPVILITIGLLFAINNFTRFGFEQTWPVLLIVIGLMSLLRRGVEPAPPPPAPHQPGSFTGPGYSQSPYSQTPPAAAPDSASGPAKGGFGTTAAPRPADAPPATPPSDSGGSI